MNCDFEEYLITATKFGITRKAKDFQAGSRHADKLSNLGAKMRTAADGQRYLLTLLSNEDPYVVLWAAKDCLFFAPARALPVLETIAQIDGLLSLSAATTLDEWRKGGLS